MTCFRYHYLNNIFLKVFKFKEAIIYLFTQVVIYTKSENAKNELFKGKLNPWV